MNTRALLLELLISGFFAIACFRARADSETSVAMNPRDMLRLTDRLERLRRTRWQWFAMVLVIVFVRLQSGLPLVVEMTAALQFVVFLALPTKKSQQRTVAGVSRRRATPLARRSIRSAKAN
jgi:hypothetical protein